MAKVIVVKQDRCLGCRSCEIHCALAHSQAETLVEALTAEEKPQSRVYVEPSGQFCVPLQCRHCEDAPCVTICPAKAKAISRATPDAPVLIDGNEMVLIWQSCQRISSTVIALMPWCSLSSTVSMGLLMANTVGVGSLGNAWFRSATPRVSCR